MQSVTLIAFDGIQPLDLVGPHETFAAANRALAAQGRRPAYRMSVQAPSTTATSTSGLRMMADPLGPTSPDLLVVPGGEGSQPDQGSAREEVVDWLRRASPRRLLTVCTGAFLAADAGLLNGHRVTTHWAYADALARRHPELTVDPAPVWLHDGRVWSSGGVTAGIDLALAVVAHDLGGQVAQTVARWLVMSLRRPGNQSQFAAPVWVERAEDDRIRRAQEWIETNPSADHHVDRLAERVSLSPRHFQRLFAQQVGRSVGAYLAELRLENARRALTQTDMPTSGIARTCGYGTEESLRRAFVSHLGITPSAYRHSHTLEHHV